MTPIEDAASHEEEEGRLCRSTGWAAAEPLLHLWDGGWSAREGQTPSAAAGRAELLMGTPPALLGVQGRWAAELGMEHGKICPAPHLARGRERGTLTDVGVLQEAADPGFSFQFLVI